MGKSVGGTLGVPLEGQPGPHDLTFYRPEPTETLPNDDLDLQVVWLHHLRVNACRSVTPEILAEAWAKHVLFPFDEYNVSRRNRAHGLSGARQGAADNFFGECMGAAIRSEVWACLAPGDPARAAGFAWADAVVDHCGDGVWAEVFNAALQAAAFTESDPDRLIDTALAFLPEQSQLKRALARTREWWRECKDWREVRRLVVENYATGNFTHVVCNICFQLIGWFDGGDDFGRSICTAVNCGFDTDCTGATLGALLGILRPDDIPARWLAPIGEKVVLSREIVGFNAPRDLGELTDWTLEVSVMLANFSPTLLPIEPHAPPTVPATSLGAWKGWTAALHDVTSAETLLKTPGAGETFELPGFWSRWTAEQLGADGRLLVLHFNAPRRDALKLMVWFPPGVKVWVDGRAVLSYGAGAFVADPMAAPSFHRAGPSAVVLPELAGGTHVLAIALSPITSGQCADLVWGFADAKDDLWATDVVP